MITERHDAQQTAEAYGNQIEDQKNISPEGIAPKGDKNSVVATRQSQYANYTPYCISLESIIADENQPRIKTKTEGIEELADNIEQYGLIEPIIVTPLNNGKFQLIQGERRYRAYIKLKEKHPDDNEWKSISAVVIDNANPALKIISSLVRNDLNTMEYADALGKLKGELGEGTTNKMLACLLGKSEPNISEWLSLLRLPEEVIDHAKANNILSLRILKGIPKKASTEEEMSSQYFSLCNLGVL